MSTIISRFSTIILLSSFLLLGGCGSAPTLESKSPVVPVGIDLSGNWTLRQDGSAQGPRQVGDPDESIVLMSKSQRQQRSQRARSSSGASAHVFLEFGQSLKITQTRYSLFISYDRSVVEEYTFGENRKISIGPIEAVRVSGWDSGSFVVETLDHSGTILFETWSLQEGGAVLLRDIRISHGDKDSYVRQQLFDRD